MDTVGKTVGVNSKTVKTEVNQIIKLNKVNEMLKVNEATNEVSTEDKTEEETTEVTVEDEDQDRLEQNLQEIKTTTIHQSHGQYK